jgi:hypothetical protein
MALQNGYRYWAIQSADILSPAVTGDATIKGDIRVRIKMSNDRESLTPGVVGEADDFFLQSPNYYVISSLTNRRGADCYPLSPDSLTPPGWASLKIRTLPVRGELVDLVAVGAYVGGGGRYRHRTGAQRA